MPYTFALLRLSALSLLSLTLIGCDGVSRVDPDTDDSETQFQLDYRDFEEAALTALSSLAESGTLPRGKRDVPVLAIGRFANNTTLHIDMDQLVKKIRVELVNSGRVNVSTIVSADVDNPEEKINLTNRSYRTNDEFDQSSIPGKGTLQAADYSLSGKIIQSGITKTRKAARDPLQLEYYFQMTLTDLVKGYSVWEGESLIVKRGFGKVSVSW